MGGGLPAPPPPGAAPDLLSHSQHSSPQFNFEKAASGIISSEPSRKAHG